MQPATLGGLFLIDLLFLANATDGATNDLLWEGVDKRGGNAPMLQNTTDSWLDVHNAFKAWAAGMVTKLQQAGICETKAAAPT